ncbi:MAG TPA: hypothetical protein PLM81_04785 [Ginsengibacter sp.]|nr:hypothetical protein [Chitinophagaceae bacterium]MCZ2396036.1 hypothetical protein [Chitinophagales bacterium]HRN72420.1 hypothetical protein [Ginsengibacter sp.]HRP18225.1 hypothetical protein [Ginsengibacter sp.]HRP43424.1 hypothetical protein [Ginsengibacter sp.]
MKIMSSMVLCIISIAACTQTNNISGNQNAEAVATYYYRLPGTIAVDENGNEIPPIIDTVYTVYVITKDSVDHWETACIKGKYFDAYATLSNQDVVALESAEATDEKINIEVPRQSRLWIVSLSLRIDKKEPRPEHETTSWIAFTIAGKRYLCPIKKLIRVEGIPSV